MSENDERTEFEEEDGPLTQPVGRRALLRAGLIGGAGLAAAALIGCGDDDDDDDDDDDATTTATTAATTATPTATATTQVAADGGEEPWFISAARNDGAPVPYDWPEPAGTPKKGGILRLAVSWDISTFDPTKSTAGGTGAPINPVYNRLVGIVTGPEMGRLEVKLTSELAKDWEISADGLTYTFNLQEGVKWQNLPPLNGRDFVAEDVKFAFERGAAEGVQRVSFSSMDSMETPDDHTLVIKLNEPNPDFIIPIAMRTMPIYPRELVEQDLIDSTAIGTGPAIMTDAAAGERVVFETNPDYWETEPLLEGAEYRIMPDIQARLAAFRAEQVEYAHGIARNTRDHEALLATNPDHLFSTNPILQSFGGWGWNLNDSRFSDERVRRAHSLALNRPQIAQVLFQGFAKFVAIQPWPFVFDDFPTDEQMGPWWRYDPDEAKKMLSAAGAEDLEYNIISWSGYGGQSANELYQQLLADVGITISLGSVDYTELNSQWTAASYPEAADGKVIGLTPAANTGYFDFVHSQSSLNYWNINDSELDAWAEQQKVEGDADGRREIQRKMWDKLQDQVYRLDFFTAYSISHFQPWLRYMRFGGAYDSIGIFHDWGRQYQWGWLDK